MQDVAAQTVIRLALDINVFISDLLARRKGLLGGAAVMLMDAVRGGRCPAGPVQLITSLPIMENYANVLRRRFQYSAMEADEKAWLLEQYALEGPLPCPPLIAIGSGFIPFETEQQLKQAIQQFSGPASTGKLFNEIQDDRYVLETALAGRADILATGDIDDFVRGDAVKLTRKDVALYPLAGHTLVIAKPSFVAFWLRQGIVPNASFIAGRVDEFGG